MMDDGSKRPEDELPLEDEFLDEFDDLDIEDIDIDDVDFSDDPEVWDAEEDLDSDEALAAPTKKGKKAKKDKKVKVPKEPKAKKPKREKVPGKKGGKKVLFAGVAVVALVGGAVVFLGAGDRGQPSSQMAVQPAVPDESDVGQNMPPMPIPVDGDASVDDLPPDLSDIADLQDSVPVEQDQALTPMPEIGDDIQESGEALAPLPMMGAEDDLSDQVAALPQFDLPEEDVPVQDDNNEMPEITSAEIPPMPDIDASAEDIVEAPEPEVLPDDFAEQESVSELADNEMPEAAPLPNPDVPSLELEELSREMDELRERNSALAQEKQEEAEKLQSANSKIASLQDTVRDLENQIKSLNKSLEFQAQSKSEPKAAPVPERKAESVSKPAPKPTMQNTPPARDIQWKLRSAQPGKAVISDPRTGDTRSVQVGESIDGIGRITSIAPEGGLWVVRGTKGIVSQ